MRDVYTKLLTRLNDLLTEMGRLIETAISLAVSALVEQNTELARQAIEYEREVDQKEREIESLCLKLLLQQQPVAGDLLLISAAMRIIGDMERIGDHAADISEVIMQMPGVLYEKNLAHIPQMAQITVEMVNEAVSAFINRDVALAKSVIERDNEVDRLFANVRADLIGIFHTENDSRDQALDLMMIAKYFEKIGDHAENIAEWVVFSITGVHKRVSWDDV